jgi:hypothetical protein
MESNIELFRFIWKYTNILNLIICCYYFFTKLNYFTNFDRFDIFDAKYFLRIISIQLIIWGTALVWSFPLLIAFLMLPYIYICFEYFYHKYEFKIFKVELILLNISIIFWIVAILHRVLYYTDSISFSWFTYLFLFQEKPLLF